MAQWRGKGGRTHLIVGQNYRRTSTLFGSVVIEILEGALVIRFNILTSLLFSGEFVKITGRFYLLYSIEDELPSACASVRPQQGIGVN